MPNITVLTEDEKAYIQEKLSEFASIPEDIENLQPYLFDNDMGDGDVNIRFFPTPESSPVEGIYFEITINDSADWKDNSLGSYSSDNLRNGGPVYQALARDLESAVESSLQLQPNFVKEKGSGAFTFKATL